jgi:hypothetical protein
MSGLIMKYFVLKPKGNHQYANASRVAMKAYANEIANENPTLANELKAWADAEESAVVLQSEGVDSEGVM